MVKHAIQIVEGRQSGKPRSEISFGPEVTAQLESDGIRKRTHARDVQTVVYQLRSTQSRYGTVILKQLVDNQFPVGFVVVDAIVTYIEKVHNLSVLYKSRPKIVSYVYSTDLIDIEKDPFG